MTPAPRPPAGSTVKDVRPPAINLDQHDQVAYTDPGPTLTVAATKLTIVTEAAVTPSSAAAPQGGSSTCPVDLPINGGSACDWGGSGTSQLAPGAPSDACKPLIGNIYQNNCATPHGNIDICPCVQQNVSPLDTFQQELNILGFIPDVGSLFNGVNGLIYLGEGQWGNAANSFLGVLPGEKDAEGLARLFGSGDRAATDGEQDLSRLGGDGARSCDTNSFTGTTPVTLANGTTEPIDKVKAGDKVLASDPQTGQTVAEPVQSVEVHGGQHTMVDVHLSGGTTITATDHHPFWDATRAAFVYAIDLRAGDQLTEPDGHLVTVTGLRVYRKDLTAYNLTVRDIHTYYAGTPGVLVHNSCPPGEGGSSKKGPPPPIWQSNPIIIHPDGNGGFTLSGPPGQFIGPKDWQPRVGFPLDPVHENGPDKGWMDWLGDLLGG